MELSAFWKNRLLRLPGACAARRGLALRRGLLLAGAALLLAATPHWQLVALSSPPALAGEPPPARDGDQPIETDIAQRNVRAQSALDKPTEMNFTEYPLDEALRYLAEYHDITIRIDQKAIEANGKPLNDRPVISQIAQAPLRTVLNVMLEPESLGYFIAGGDVVVTTREKSWAAVYELNYDMRSIVDAGVSGAELAKAIRFVIAPASWDSAGGAGSLTVKQQALVVRQRADVHQQLRILLKELRRSKRDCRVDAAGDRPQSRRYEIGDFQRAGISDSTLVGWLTRYLLPAFPVENGADGLPVIEQGQLVVSNLPASGHRAVEQFLETIRARQRAEPDHVPTRSDLEALQFDLGLEPRSLRIARTMQLAISADFSAMPLRDALHKVVTESRADVWVDSEGLRRAGVSLDTPVTLKTAPAACAEILDQILEPLRLDWRIAADIIQVTADRRLEPRVHCTNRLTGNRLSGRELAKQIESQIEPPSWTGDDSNARIYALSDSLLVMQTPRVQRKIGKLLESLSHKQKQ
jgi:hypothetical protein